MRHLARILGKYTDKKWEKGDFSQKKFGYLRFVLPLSGKKILKITDTMLNADKRRIAEILRSEERNCDVTVKGWVRTKRGNKNVAFIALNDGSCVSNIQVVVDVAQFDEELLRRITTGACLRVDGTLVESMGSGQPVEVQAKAIEIYGTADPESYPLQKKGHSLEFLREIAYLRPRTNTFGAILRIRHNMAYAIHKYFNDRGFY